MSYNQNFYNNFYGNNYAFHNMQQRFVPPPPAPPSYFIPPPQVSDQHFLHQLESKICPHTKHKENHLSLTKLRENLRNILKAVDEIKQKEKDLSSNVSTLSDEEWQKIMKDIECKKTYINDFMTNTNEHLELLKKLVNKRSAKRLRLKRVRLERKREEEEMSIARKETSRKIDENLQKIQDDITRVKQEEEAKLQADIVLKEVRRKKGDAKKLIVKLDALIKLRQARLNTAKGRGAVVSQPDANAFNTNIEKLKTFWKVKLSTYDKEESDLQAKLTQDHEVQQNACNNKPGNSSEDIVANLGDWWESLFGEKGTMPQANLHGDMPRFVAVRSQWDQYLNSEGSPIPIGWVLPSSQA